MRFKVDRLVGSLPALMQINVKRCLQKTTYRHESEVPSDVVTSVSCKLVGFSLGVGAASVRLTVERRIGNNV